MPNRLGYCCINLTIGKQFTTNRSMRKATFESKGLIYVSEIALNNVKDILPILKWNAVNDIYVYRMSSCLIPWQDRIILEDLKDYKEICIALKEAGDFAKSHGMRLSFHPSQFILLSSVKEKVVTSSIAELEMHGKIMDLMGLPQTQYAHINIHVGAASGGKHVAMDRFADNFKRLSKSVQSRLVVENDDRPSMYTVRDLTYLYDKIGTPITFDFFHHECQQDPMSQEEAFKLAASTWPSRIAPSVHYSESKRLHENDSKIKVVAHSDMINNLPNTYGVDVDIEVEVKMKELALLRIREQINMCHYSGLRTVESYETIEA